MLRQIAFNAQGLRAWNELRSEIDYCYSYNFNTLSQYGFVVVNHSIMADKAQLEKELPHLSASHTTSCKLDLDKALVKSIWVLKDGGKWIIRQQKLHKTPIKKSFDEFPREKFQTNYANFDDEFDAAEKNIYTESH